MLTSETTVTSCVDWLSVTRQDNKYPVTYPKEKKEMKRGMMGYDTGLEYIDGRMELCSSTRPEMGVHVIISGETISRLCELVKITSFDIVNDLGARGVTRLDIAIDVKYGTLHIAELFNMLELDKVDTSIEKWLYLQGAKKQGETLYVGAPGSDKRVRIYDKSAESGTDYEWTRIELQYRHKYAKRAARALLGTSEPHLRVASMINEFINFKGNREWSMVMGSDTIKLGKPEPSSSNRREWLLDTAATALASEMVVGVDGKRFLEEFIRSALDKYGVKKDEYHTGNLLRKRKSRGR